MRSPPAADRYVFKPSTTDGKERKNRPAREGQAQGPGRARLSSLCVSSRPGRRRGGGGPQEELSLRPEAFKKHFDNLICKEKEKCLSTETYLVTRTKVTLQACFNLPSKKVLDPSSKLRQHSSSLNRKGHDSGAAAEARQEGQSRCEATHPPRQGKRPRGAFTTAAAHLHWGSLQITGL